MWLDPIIVQDLEVIVEEDGVEDRVGEGEEGDLVLAAQVQFNLKETHQDLQLTT